MSLPSNIQAEQRNIRVRICTACGTHPCAAGEDLCAHCRRGWWAHIEQEKSFHRPPVHNKEPRCVRCRIKTPLTQSSGYCPLCQVQQIHDRDAAIFWARTLFPPRQSRQDWVVLDTETTGLDRMAEIVEISIVAPDGQVLLDTLVRPLNPIPPAATAIHQISDVMVVAAPTFPHVYDELVRLIQGRTVITYNVAFDRRMVWQAQQRYKLPPVNGVRWTCAMQQYARYIGEWNPSRQTYRWQNLESGDHTALGDCRATLRLLQRMAADTLSIEERSSSCSLTTGKHGSAML